MSSNPISSLFQTPAIGIDLGIVNSRVAFYSNNELTIIGKSTPSMVAFTDTKERHIGGRAKSYFNIHPERTAYDMKHLICRNFNDPIVEKNVDQWPFTVAKSLDNDLAVIDVGVNFLGRQTLFYPEELTAMLAEKLKEQADGKLKKTIDSVVFTVPAYFSEFQRSAIMNAGKIAGFHYVKIVEESIAIAISYSHERDSRRNSNVNVVVYSMGADCFTASVFTIKRTEHKPKQFICDVEIKRSVCRTHIGGLAFDALLVNHVADIIKEKYKTELNKRAMRKLREECELAKCSLSSCLQWTLDLGDVLGCGDCEEQLTITRDTFVGLCADLFRETITTLEEALSKSRLKKEYIDEVMMTGGSSRIPGLFQLLDKFIPKNVPIRQVHQDVAVVRGAAIFAAWKSDVENPPDLHISGIDTIPLPHFQLGATECMIANAELYRNNDKERTELFAARHDLESYVRELEAKAINMALDDPKNDVEQMLAQIGDWITSELPKADIQDVKARHSTLKMVYDGILAQLE